jgi:hypothetical protein
LTSTIFFSNLLYIFNSCNLKLSISLASDASCGYCTDYANCQTCQMIKYKIKRFDIYKD